MSTKPIVGNWFETIEGPVPAAKAELPGINCPTTKARMATMEVRYLFVARIVPPNRKFLDFNFSL